MTVCNKCNQPTRYIQSLNMYQTTCDSCHKNDEIHRWYPVKSFENKLKRLGITVELGYNVPWIYLDKVNGVKVKERFHANHGFTAFYYPVRANGKIKFSDMKYVFNKIRQMIEGTEQLPDNYEEYENRS